MRAEGRQWAARSRQGRTRLASRQAADTSSCGASPGWACGQSWARSWSPGPRCTPPKRCSRSLAGSESRKMSCSSPERTRSKVIEYPGACLAGEGVRHPDILDNLRLVVPELIAIGAVDLGHDELDCLGHQLALLPGHRLARLRPRPHLAKQGGLGLGIFSSGKLNQN